MLLRTQKLRAISRPSWVNTKLHPELKFQTLKSRTTEIKLKQSGQWRQKIVSLQLTTDVGLDLSASEIEVGEAYHLYLTQWFTDYTSVIDV